MKQTDVAIVGAGLAGLAAGRDLTAAGLDVLILDKGRGVGGRMASRRFDGAVFDTGAQFFSARDERFRALLEGTIVPQGAAAEWYRRGSECYYRGVPGMTGPAKLLAATLPVRTGSRVTALVPEAGGWRLRYEGPGSPDVPGDPDELFARGVILTPPVPQSLALLEAHREDFADESLALLAEIDYTPTLALLLRLDGDSPIAAPGYDRPTGDPILSWVADNRRKGVSPAASGPTLTVHGRPEFSEVNYDAPEDEVIAAIMERFLLRYPRDGRYEVVARQLKRWRYARPLHPTPERAYLINRPERPPVAVAGDAFGGPRVEGAWLSGITAAELMKEALSS
jgi:renalase